MRLFIDGTHLGRQQADAGEIVVAIRDGEATVKRLSRRDGQIFLMPENPAYKPIPAGEGSGYELVGKVVGVLRIF